jgi:hypothetical protein
MPRRRLEEGVARVVPVASVGRAARESAVLAAVRAVRVAMRVLAVTVGPVVLVRLLVVLARPVARAAPVDQRAPLVRGPTVG